MLIVAAFVAGILPVTEVPVVLILGWVSLRRSGLRWSSVGLRRPRMPAWARRALWLSAGLVVLTGGMAPVVWGEAGLFVGLVAALACAGIAALVFWLAMRERGQV